MSRLQVAAVGEDDRLIVVEEGSVIVIVLPDGVSRRTVFVPLAVTENMLEVANELMPNAFKSITSEFE
jgi:hypothetical protein